MANELLTWPGSSPTAVSDYQAQNTILAAVIAGFMRLSLTEWATSAIPQIAAGSIVEVGGSLYQFASSTSISGSPTDGVRYVYIVCSGSDATPTWSTTAPTWDSAKNGWYNGDNRCVAKMTKASTSYTLKELYVNYPANWIYGAMLQDAILSTAKYIDRSVTSDKVALLAITNALIANATIANAKLASYAAGDYPIYRGGGGSNNTSTPTDVTSVVIPKGGTLRIKFSLNTNTAVHGAYARIYRNGSAVGTERMTQEVFPYEYSQDISGWSAGEEVRVYAWNDYGSTVATVSGLSIFVATPDFAIIA